MTRLLTHKIFKIHGTDRRNQYIYSFGIWGSIVSAHACSPPTKSNTRSKPQSRSFAAANCESFPLLHITTTAAPCPLRVSSASISFALISTCILVTSFFQFQSCTKFCCVQHTTRCSGCNVNRLFHADSSLDAWQLSQNLEGSRLCLLRQKLTSRIGTCMDPYTRVAL
jgi:hypothetical protein